MYNTFGFKVYDSITRCELSYMLRRDDPDIQNFITEIMVQNLSNFQTIPNDQRKLVFVFNETVPECTLKLLIFSTIQNL
jgi:hypothetical protein